MNLPVAKKFTVTGGRAGSITFREGEASGQLSWEMLVGDVAMVIYPSGCFWLTPREVAMQDDEIRRLLQEFAREEQVAADIAFTSGDETVYPSSEAQLAADRKFYDLLGAEREGHPCRRSACSRGAISQSVLCRRHQFESIRGKECPFDD